MKIVKRWSCEVYYMQTSNLRSRFVWLPEKACDIRQLHVSFHVPDTDVITRFQEVSRPDQGMVATSPLMCLHDLSRSHAMKAW